MNFRSSSMSYVVKCGPRPHTHHQDLFKNRLMPLLDGVKPGLTG